MTFFLFCLGFTAATYIGTVLFCKLGDHRCAYELDHAAHCADLEHDEILRELDAEFPAARALPEAEEPKEWAPKEWSYSDVRAIIDRIDAEHEKVLSSRSLPSEGGAPVRMDTLETLVDGKWVHNEVLRFGL